MAKHILVIDDAKDFRMLLRVALEKAGDRVTELSSAGDLDNQLPKIAPDLIVSDIMMPGEDGLSLCKRIQADPARRLPVILISAKIFEADKHAALQAGAVGYLTKPFHASQLVELIGSVLT